MAASWARFSLAAATICMARVIFCVALTLAMRFRISFKLAIGQSPIRAGLKRRRR